MSGILDDITHTQMQSNIFLGRHHVNNDFQLLTLLYILLLTGPSLNIFMEEALAARSLWNMNKAFEKEIKRNFFMEQMENKTKLTTKSQSVLDQCDNDPTFLLRC